MKKIMATLAVTIAVALFIVAFIKFLLNYVHEIKLCQKCPTPSLPLPFIGHSHLLYNVNREDIVETIIELTKVDTVRRKMATIIGFHPIIWYYHPEPVEEILSSTELISKSDEYIYLRVGNKNLAKYIKQKVLILAMVGNWFADFDPSKMAHQTQTFDSCISFPYS